MTRGKVYTRTDFTVTWGHPERSWFVSYQDYSERIMPTVIRWPRAGTKAERNIDLETEAPKYADQQENYR